MSSLTGFVQRNKQAVIATAAVLAVGAGVGAYYVYKSAPDSTATTDGGASAGSVSDDQSSAQSASSKKKKKKNDKKKKTQQPKTNTLFGFPLVKYGENGPEYPDMKPDSDLRGLTNEELKDMAGQLKAAGNAAFNGKDYEKAIQLYTSAIRCDDKEPIFYSNRAACYNSLKEYQKVIDDTTKALGLKPDYVKCLSRRAVAYEKLGQYKEAIFDFTATCILNNFQDQSLNSAVDRVLKLQAEKLCKEDYNDLPKKLPSANFIKSYLKSFRDRELPDSVKNATEESGDYYLKLAFDALEQESIAAYEQAQGYFEKAVENKASNLALALEYRGTFKFLLNDTKGALEDINRSIEEKPTVQAYIKRSSIHMEDGSLNAAKADFEAALRLDPNSPDVYYHRAQVAFLTGDFNEAVKDYEQSASLEKDFMFSHLQLAVTQYRMQSLQTAIASFRKLLKQYPDSSDVHNYYGEVLLDQNNYEDAIKEFDTAIELETNKTTGTVNVLCLVNKAIAVFQKNQDIQEAEQLCRKAIALDDASDVAIGTLAQFCLQQGKTDDALKYFEMSAEIARTDVERIQALQYAEAARTQLRIMQERPELRQRLERLNGAGQ